MWRRRPPLEAQICVESLVLCYPRKTRIRLAQGRAPRKLTLNSVVVTFEKHLLQSGRRPLADFQKCPESADNVCECAVPELKRRMWSTCFEQR